MSRFTTVISPAPSWLAAAAWLALSACCLGGEPISLGVLGSPEMISRFVVPGGSTMGGEDGLQITFNAKSGRGDFAADPAQNAWNSAAALGLEVENTGVAAARLTVQAGGRIGFRSLNAGERVMLALPLQARARVAGMKVPPPFENWGSFQGIKSQSSVRKPGTISFQLESSALASMRLVRAVLLPPVDTTAMVDLYGQYARRDWPGKIYNDDDLRAADPVISGKKSPALDQFGGWINGPKLKTTGWFHVEKAEGRWCLVTPEGHAFFSLGINAVTAQNTTLVQGREKMFAALPIGSGKMADFYQANLVRKFSQDWQGTWRKQTLARLGQWGFNTLGAWSDEALFSQPPHLSYTVILHVDGDFARIGVAGSGGKTMPDPFDPRLAAAISEWMRKNAAPYRDDPWLLGYFVGNELPLGAWTGHARHAVVLGALAGQDLPAKNALIAHLRTMFPKAEMVSSRWGTQIDSWEAFSRRAFQPSKEWTPEFEQDIEMLSKFFAERYFQTVRDTIRASDPHHLYLGSRFASSTPEFVAAAAKFCDVTSFNIYRSQISKKDPVMKHFSQFDRPALVSEFHFGANDRGLFATGIAGAPSQSGRGDAYARYVSSAANLPFFVGCHWFQYLDQLVSGRVGDGENFGIGLVTVTDQPYPELLTPAAAFNRAIYTLRATRGTGEKESTSAARKP